MNNSSTNGTLTAPRSGASDADKLRLQPMENLLKSDSKGSSNGSPAPAPAKVASASSKRKWLFRGIAIIAGAVAFTVAAIFYIEGLDWEGTDDAFIEGHVLQISAKISNQVQTVFIDDNQFVHKGDLLVKIDDRDYQIQLEEAQANYAKAVNDFQRVSGLMTTGASSKSDYDAAQATLDVTKSRLDQAKLNLSYTEIRAPESGKVTRKNVEPGDYLQIGQTVCAIVPQHFWVLANYKETQLARMHVGQKVVIWVDSLPDRKLIGHVDSLQSGTGSEFSLLPPENATGNYVKVVQRIPVKIVFDEPDDVVAQLAPGMSVQPEVHIQ